ncbi:hypothetical protein ColKHC_12673 [Colletotrichum higginsianum]|nr:hypothetical protein ColKHC_12673 [Colletotrichum higginsianum]
MSGFTKFRAGLTAAGCAAIIFTGATYGAGLKTQKEWKERGRLVTERRNWESKLTYLEERIVERAPKKPES